MRWSPIVSAGACLVAILPAVTTAAPRPSAAALPPSHAVVVSGTGVTPSSTWPAYDAEIDRYAVATTAQTDGSLTVAATTTDPEGTLRVDGRVSTGPVTVDGLAEGDEVNVQITDSGGTSNQSFVYLPASFPRLTTSQTPNADVAAGDVLLGISSFLSSHAFEAAIDHRGVPRYVRAGASNDLKASGPGYTVARQPANSSGYEIVELDDQFRRTGTRQLKQTPDQTDFHDSEILPDGRALLIGYRPATHDSDGKNYLDAVIELQDAQGHATWEWDSKDHIDPAEAYVAPPVMFGDYADYAHINSVQLVGPYDDVLASFRNLSQVRLIATQPHDGLEAGQTIWTFGGAENQFTILDGSGGPDGGPCAQHMARLLPDGHLTVFDNGSRFDGAGALGGQTADMCEDPADPTGPRIARPQTRVTEYALDFTDPASPVATLVWQFAPDHRYAAFAGGQQRLPGGNRFVGWSYAVDSGGAGVPQPMASEVTPAGEEIWTVSAPGWFSYRADQADVHDAIPPTVALAGPVDGASYDAGTAAPTLTYGCTDRGGSNLDECSGTIASGESVPMTTGPHTLTVTATDRAGNATTRTIGYTVLADSPPPTATPSPTTTPTTTATPSPAPTPQYQPDAEVKQAGSEAVGDGILGSARHQTVRLTIGSRHVDTAYRVLVKVRNDGARKDRFTITGPAGSRRFGIRYRSGGDVTALLRTGLRTPALGPGQSYRLVLLVTRKAAADVGDRRRIVVTATSRHDGDAVDKVAVVLKAR